ncbi:MAG: hypothetical protein RLZ35_1204 [Pseudomonadota bacterium]|jgi:hypothetical protein
MKKSIDDRIKTFFSDYSVIVSTTALHIACEYPLWSIKVHMQNDPSKHQNILITAKDIYRKKGFINGFYSGAMPFCALTLCKQSYRLPALSFLPNYYQSWLPESFESNDYGIPNIATATTLSIFETTVFGPVERVVCYRVIHKELPSITIKFLYTGTGIAFGKGLFSWNLFCGLENFAQTQAKKLLKTDKLNTQSTFGVGIFVGSATTMISQPLSGLQTFAQTRLPQDNGSLLTGFKAHLKKHGTTALFAGIRPALLQGIVRSSITVFALKHLRENK